jgi:hypothetical protein
MVSAQPVGPRSNGYVDGFQPVLNGSGSFV